MTTQQDTTEKRLRAIGSAPGKLILFGEHAVVYNQPAIAVPLSALRARAVAVSGRRGYGMVLHAETIGRHYLLDAVSDKEPLAFTCRNVLRWLQIDREPDVDIHLDSEIPIASGLGSGAATAAALARALARWLGYEFSAEQLSALVYRTETLHHGTPSGIDNTVVAFEKPLWFRRNAPLETLPIKGQLCLVIADSGESSPTRITVGDVRRRWQADPVRYEALFAAIGEVAQRGRIALAQGDLATVGALMNENQQLLQALGVSAPSNERLAEVARRAGALGAKLSGGGRGGNNVALVYPADVSRVVAALLEAGARQTFVSS